MYDDGMYSHVLMPSMGIKEKHSWEEDEALCRQRYKDTSQHETTSQIPTTRSPILRPTCATR